MLFAEAVDDVDQFVQLLPVFAIDQAQDLGVSIYGQLHVGLQSIRRAVLPRPSSVDWTSWR